MLEKYDIEIQKIVDEAKKIQSFLSTQSEEQRAETIRENDVLTRWQIKLKEIMAKSLSQDLIDSLEK